MGQNVDTPGNETVDAEGTSTKFPGKVTVEQPNTATPSSPPSPPTAEGSVGESDPEKAARIAKLQKESALLEQQLSKSGIAREWLKSLTGLAAIGALIAALFQLQSGRDQRTDERFDHAIARLSSSSTAEQLAGISSLRVFVEEGD